MSAGPGPGEEAHASACLRAPGPAGEARFFRAPAGPRPHVRRNTDTALPHARQTRTAARTRKPGKQRPLLSIGRKSAENQLLTLK